MQAPKYCYSTDDLFPTIALSDAFSGTIGILFIIA
jgi:hypothetical protein